MINSMNISNIGVAFSLATLAGLTTAVGGLLAFVGKKDNLKFLSYGLGFSAGVMIFVSLMDIIPESNRMLMINFPNKYQWMVYTGFVLGILVSFLIDYFLPDHIDTDEYLNPDTHECDDYEKRHKLKRAGIFTAVAICIHNFPEGMATFLTATQSVTLGISVAFAIAIHNIPEGIAVALPIYHVTGKKRYAMLYAAISGITEPVGALVGMFIFNMFLPQVLVGCLMATVAGIMVYISFDTLLPLAKEYGDWHCSIWGIMSGIMFIWLSLILMGI
ncbi:zinc transporter ZupT [bacterium]|nr:zinc transporter ZupT [bacterium]